MSHAPRVVLPQVHLLPLQFPHRQVFHHAQPLQVLTLPQFPLLARSYLAVLAAPKEKESLFDSLVVRSSQDEVEVSWGSAGIEVFLPSS